MPNSIRPEMTPELEKAVGEEIKRREREALGEAQIQEALRGWQTVKVPKERQSKATCDHVHPDHGHPREYGREYGRETPIQDQTPIPVGTVVCCVKCGERRQLINHPYDGPRWESERRLRPYVLIGVALAALYMLIVHLIWRLGSFSADDRALGASTAGIGVWVITLIIGGMVVFRGAEFIDKLRKYKRGQ